MTNERRLEKALSKIEARKQRLQKTGVTEPSKFGYVMRDLIAPLFRFGVGSIYPKSGCVLLGNINRKDIKRLTKGQPVIYAPAHRGIYDASRVIAHAIPHSYIISGDERVFYCTHYNFLLELNGVLHFDRESPLDRRLLIERASRILLSNHSIYMCPEGTPNTYSREMLKLYPGIIKIALNTGAVIVPVGNEIHILRNKKTKKITGDINYMMYEDYSEQTLFRPSDNHDLATLHNLLKDLSFLDIIDVKSMASFINNGKFTVGSVDIDLYEKLQELLISHPNLKGCVNNRTREYLMRCAVLSEYTKILTESKNKLEQRMIALSDKISIEIDKRNPITPEERDKRFCEYTDYYLDKHERIGKKGRFTAYDQNDKFINIITDERRIENDTRKILRGLEILDC